MKILPALAVTGLLLCGVSPTLAWTGPPTKDGDTMRVVRYHGPPPYQTLLPSDTIPVHPRALAAYDRLIRETQIPWQVEWHHRTGGARYVACRKTPRYDGPAYFGPGDSCEDEALNFISEYLELFWPTSEERSLAQPEFRVNERSRARRRGFRLNHYSQGIQVYKSTMGVRFDDRDGGIRRVSAGLWPVAETDVSPGLTAESAIEKVRAILPTTIWAKVRGVRIHEGPELIILPSNPPRLVYRVFAQYAAVFLVDCNSGDIYVDSSMIPPTQPAEPPQVGDEDGAASSDDDGR